MGAGSCSVAQVLMFTWAASQRKVTCGAGGAPAIPQYAPLSTERKGNVQKYTEKIRHLGQNQINLNTKD